MVYISFKNVSFFVSGTFHFLELFFYLHDHFSYFTIVSRRSNCVFFLRVSLTKILKKGENKRNEKRKKNKNKKFFTLLGKLTIVSHK